MIDNELRQAASDLRTDVDNSPLPAPVFRRSEPKQRSVTQMVLVAAVIMACVAGGLFLARGESDREFRLETPAEDGNTGEDEVDSDESEERSTTQDGNEQSLAIGSEQRPPLEIDPVAETDSLKPTGVRLEVDGDTVTLRWSPSLEAKGYNVYRNDAYYATVRETRFVDEQVPAGRYVYYVTAFDETETVFSSRSLGVAAVVGASVPVPETSMAETSVVEAGPVLQKVELAIVVSDHPSISGTVLSWRDDVNVNVHAYNVYRDGEYLDTVEWFGSGSFSYTDAGQAEFEGAEYRLHAVRVDADAPEGYEWGPFVTAKWELWSEPDEQSLPSPSSSVSNSVSDVEPSVSVPSVSGPSVSGQSVVKASVPAPSVVEPSVPEPSVPEPPVVEAGPVLREVELAVVVSDHPSISGTVLSWRDDVNVNVHAYNVYRDGEYLDTVEWFGSGSFSYTDAGQAEFEGAEYRVHAVRVDADAPEGYEWGPFVTAEWKLWSDPGGQNVSPPEPSVPEPPVVEPSVPEPPVVEAGPVLREVELAIVVSDHPSISGTVLSWRDDVNVNVHAYNVYRDGEYLDTVEWFGSGSFSYPDAGQAEFEGAEYRVHAVRVDADAPEGYEWGPFVTAEWKLWSDTNS